jgi:hypothetical protein
MDTAVDVSCLADDSGAVDWESLLGGALFVYDLSPAEVLAIKNLADNGHSEAQCVYAVWQSVHGINPMHYYRLAADQGHPYACRVLGHYLATGNLGVSDDKLESAIKYLEKGGENGKYRLNMYRKIRGSEKLLREWRETNCGRKDIFRENLKKQREWIKNDAEFQEWLGDNKEMRALINDEWAKEDVD